MYYLFPEKNVKPESPYWYSDKSVTEGVIKKMLNRAKVVREVQITKLEHMQIWSAPEDLCILYFQ